jgi:hypothetical protein
LAQSDAAVRGFIDAPGSSHNRVPPGTPAHATSKSRTKHNPFGRSPMKRAGIGIAVVAIAIALAGCASPPQNPVQLGATTLTTKTTRVGVAMSALPKVDTHLPGAGCLLCLAAASLANSTLTAHTRTLPYEELPKLKVDVAELLRKKGIDVTVIAEDLDTSKLPDHSAKGENIARKDYSSLRDKYKVDKLLVIEVSTLGVIRTYSAYIPTSDPKAVLNGIGYMVNLSNNTYEWYLPVNVTKSADRAWDEPPKFPGVTNAYFQTLEIGRDSFLKPFN